MKSFLFVIFSSIFSFAIGQNRVEDSIRFKAIYQLTYQPDSTNLEDVRTEEFILYRGGKFSAFASKGRILRDSLAASISVNAMGTINLEERAARTKTDFNYVIYKGFPEGKISYTNKILRDHFRYEENLDLLSWEIMPETRQIKRYTAQKAITSYAGREYVAWFTSEIPIPDGPYKFNGLPGLILSIHDTKQHYVFELSSFGGLKKPIFFELDRTEFIVTKKKKMLELEKEYALNPFAVLERNNTAGKTVMINFKEGQKEKLLQQSKKEWEKKNNLIELK